MSERCCRHRGAWLVRRRSLGAVFCSSTVEVVGEGPPLR